jgi:hypothetical protein
MDDHVQLKRDWARFIDGLLKALKWRPADLAAQIGVSRSCVQRWRTNHVRLGTIPRQAARQRLLELARERGLVAQEENRSR